MKKILFGFGILAMLFATATLTSCGNSESTDEKSELKEGEEKACCKDKKCDKKGCDKKCSEECKAEGEGKCGHGEEEGAEHKCSDMKCGEGKCGHGDEEGAEEEEGSEEVE